MTTTDYVALLNDRKTDLSSRLGKRDVISAERCSDEVDETQRIQDREIQVRDIDSMTRELRRVKAALQRAQDGTFGICISCEETIGPARMKAIPWAEYCITCQVVADHRAKEGLSMEGEDE